MNRPILTLCVLLCLLALWLMWTAFEPNITPVPATAAMAPRTAGSSISISQAEKSQGSRKPLQIKSKGKVRLRPGESAVLGYWEIAAGMNGMAIVTPETTPEGQVKMSAKLLQLSDAAVSDADAHDLFPDIFDFENYSAVDPQRLSDLQTNLQSTRGADTLAAPTVLTLPGQRASISIGNAGGTMLSLDLQADQVADGGGYDLSMELQRQE